jgi:hypothetical protein
MQPSGAPVEEAGHATMAQVERILQSDTLRGSLALRRLLKFLADKLVAGEADQLKEYGIGVDVLGKPASYDPRQDSAVRIQMGRLRQKLAEYYRGEGKDDPLIVELPRGRFKLTVAAQGHESLVETPRRYRITWERALLAIVLVWAVLATAIYWRDRQSTQIFREMWTPALAELWGPFLTGRRPLVVSIEDPPFVQFKGFGTYRDMRLNRWEDILKSPDVATIRKALRDPEMQPSVYYAPVGEVSAAFLVGKLLGPRVPALSLVRTSELSWQMLSNNNVIYIGASVFFSTRLAGLPAKLDLVNVGGGVRNLNPRAGEQSMYSEEPTTAADGDDEVHALVTHVPGPLGAGEIMSFTSQRTPGRLAAVQWFTDQAFAGTLLSHLKMPGRAIPRYYQILLKVTFKSGVPTETSYLLHHEVKPLPTTKE